MKVITTNLLNRFWKNGVKPIKDSLSSKVNVSDIVNNLTTTAANKALDARQGKALNDKITTLNSNLSQGGSGYSKLPDGTFIQYGFFGGNSVTNGSKNATVQTTFPFAFANTAPVAISVTPANANFLNSCSIDNIELTGFRTIFAGALQANTTYNCGFRWIAIGRWK